jgi:hypothetical protein
VYLFYFGITCCLTNYLTHNQLCNTLPGTTREEKVASLDPLHLQAWQAAAAMKPKPQMIKYHEAFLKGYLELLLFRQQYGTIKVPRTINKSLNEWLHNQRTYIGDYKKKKAGTKFWDNKEDRYVKILNALGVDYQART